MEKPDHAKPDLSEIFDLKRHKAVAGFVSRFEELFRDRQAVTDDIGELANEVKEANFSPIEVAAMKDIARWKTSDKLTGAAIKLAALRRVANAVKLDLFAWADEHREDDAA